MRLELALIVGILFFCTWCGYIIVKMNSSVAPPPSPLPPVQPNETSAGYLSSQYSNSQPYERLASGQYVPSKPPYTRQLVEANVPTAYFSAGPAYPSLQPQRPQTASIQIPRLPPQPPPYAGPTWRGGPAASASTWRDYSTVAAHQPASWQPSPAPYPAYSSSWRPSGPYAPRPAASRPEEPDPDPDPDAGGGSGPAEDEQPEDEDDAAPENRELEEQVGRRTYSEDEADANERDRDGNVLVTHRKHLINGKPVSSSSSDPPNGGDDGEEDDGRRAKRRRRNNNGDNTTKADSDFERIANEIDGDNQRTATSNNDYDESTAAPIKPDKQQPQAVESRTRKVVRPPNGSASQGMINLAEPLIGPRPKLIRSNIGSANRNSTRKTPPTTASSRGGRKSKPLESHEHRLRESLREQHWDDDASSPGAKDRANSALNSTGERDEPDEAPSDEQADIPEAEEPQQVDSALSELDMMVDPERFMSGSDESGNRKRRRKREAQGNLTTTAKDADSLAGAEEVNVEVVSEPPPPAPYGYGVGVPPPEQPPPAVDEAYSSFYDEQVQPTAPPAPTTINHNGHSGGHMPQPDAPTQLMVGAPDGNYYGSPMHYPEVNSIQNQLAAPEPPLGGSNFAYVYPITSGSKSKKKVKKFKRSKMEERKRKAAKAVSVKKKSKSKKGGRNKKRKKAKKKLARTYKEFEGVKKGQKKSKGGGNKGAKKGALYYKDKGYKKRGFKKAYSKLESGDHKMYFDEFRDKDHNKKWKNFKDKQRYSQSKNWTGKDKKKFKNYHLKELKDRKYGSWRDKAAHKYKKESKKSQDSSYSKHKKLKKKKKKKSKEKFS